MQGKTVAPGITKGARHMRNPLNLQISPIREGEKGIKMDLGRYVVRDTCFVIFITYTVIKKHIL